MSPLAFAGGIEIGKHNAERLLCSRRRARRVDCRNAGMKTPRKTDTAAEPPSEPSSAHDNREQRSGDGPLQAPRNVGKAPIAPGDAEPGAGAGLPLPHERDESIGDTASEPDPKIVQAYKDIVSGQIDTDLRNQPGLDAPRRAELLGGHGGGAPAPGPDPAPGPPVAPGPASPSPSSRPG